MVAMMRPINGRMGLVIDREIKYDNNAGNMTGCAVIDECDSDSDTYDSCVLRS